MDKFFLVLLHPLNNYCFNYEPRFNGVFSRNNLPRISGQSLINENCPNSRTSNDTDMELGPVTKRDKRNTTKQKHLTMTLCRQIVTSVLPTTAKRTPKKPTQIRVKRCFFSRYSF